MNMTKIGGLDLVRCIRALSKETMLVMLNQNGADRKVVEAIKLGAIDFIEKPIDGNKVQLLCEELLRRRELSTDKVVNELLHRAWLALRRLKRFVSLDRQVKF